MSVDVKKLLNAGVHFGHLTRKRHPNMVPYIFMEKDGPHILDLNQFANISYTPKKKSGDISAQLKKLHDLYKDGIITGYEYERAKKKILD